MVDMRIDGRLFEQLMRSSLAHMIAFEKELNSLNVFPVADGDTGTNMRRTIENSIAMTESNPDLNCYLKGLSNNMLLSARGNSGVILSQLFRGFYLELAHHTAATAADMRNAFVRAYKVAYEAVVNPVEGTILTVARMGIEGVKSRVVRNTTVEQLLEMYIERMEEVLQETPDMLPVLKESGVLDSGGMGYITIIRGMLAFLNGTEIPAALPDSKPDVSGTEVDFSAFNENSTFELGYCMEFILQRMNASGYEPSFDITAFIRMLEPLGNSIVAVEIDHRVKVHIHTLQPEKVIMIARRWGEFLTFKLENMQVQHDHLHNGAESEAQKSGSASAETVRLPELPKEHKEFALISVANGAGMHTILRDQGCDCVIEGGKTMSVSAREFLEIFERIDADEIIVLPNSGNIILAAEQAKDLCDQKRDHIHIVPTKNMVEGYFAMAMDLPDETDPQKRVSNLLEGIEDVKTVSLAHSVKDFVHDQLEVKAGEVTAFINGEPVASAEGMSEALELALASDPDLSERETCVLFAGNSAANGSEMQSVIEQQLMYADVSLLEGGQEVFDWMIGIL